MKSLKNERDCNEALSGFIHLHVIVNGQVLSKIVGRRNANAKTQP